MSVQQHTHMWVPWDQFRCNVCDEDGCTAGRMWARGYVFDWSEVPEMKEAVAKMSGPTPLAPEVPTDKPMLVCDCGEAFDTIATADAHKCPENEYNTFRIIPESEAF